jgi:peptide/nickel transport system substrate-binding protein
MRSGLILKLLARGALGAAAACLLLGATPPARAADKTLLVLGEGTPASLDEDGPGGTHIPSQTAMYNLLEPLLEYPIKGENDDNAQVFDFSKYEGRLATSWSFDAASNTWTLKLRDDAKSCAGNKFSADDVLYTFARAKSISGKAPVGYFLASVGSIDTFNRSLFGKTPEAIASRKLGNEVEKIDDHTVRFRLSAPNQLFLPVLSIFALRIYDHVEMEKHATADDPWSHTYTNTVNGPSFSPWCLESWKTDESFTVTRNPGYYGAKPYFDRVIYRRVPQSANRIAILRSGRAQIVDGLSPAELQSLRNVPGIKLAGGYLNTSLFMIANFKTKPLDNPKVREALAYAIPYDEIIRNSYYGQAKQAHGLIPSPYPGFHMPAATYSYDPAKARQLLAEAGFPDGKGLEAFPEAFKLYYLADREAILGPTATLLRTRLQQIGIPLQLEPLPSAQFADRQSVKRDLPLALVDQSKPLAVDPVYGMQLNFMTPPYGVSNQTNFADPDFDKLLDQTRVEPTSSPDRQKHLDQLQDMLAAKLAWIPILETKLLYAERSEIKGLVLHPSQDLIWRYLHE